jgi:Amt family ammonium transporter
MFVSLKTRPLFLVAAFALAAASCAADEQAAPSVLNAGDTAWMLVSSALVLLMIPGLAIFYGGMVGSRNVLNTMMHSFAAMAIIGVQWVVFGYALAFGDDIGGLIGWSPRYFALAGLSYQHLLDGKDIPEFVFVMFQGKFAIITPALIAGALAERISFRAYCVFILLWSTLVYDPLAHWVWAADGWLFKMGVLDFAGGTVVHISAGVSALAAVLVLGPRSGHPNITLRPNSLVLTLLGAGLLWFGWFGFNAGSAVAADLPIAGPIAGLAFTNTQTAAAMAGLSWMLVEAFHTGKPTALGMASGIVAGLVAITPAAGHVTPVWALVIGLVAGVLCYSAVLVKSRLGYDDTLDAFGIHGVGWAWGAVATGLFCTVGATGLIAGGGAQVLKQIIGVVVAALFAFVATLLIAMFVDATIGLRAKPEDEEMGLDIVSHGERGYHLDVA